MSLIRAIRGASAPLDHRLAVGDGQTMLRDAKTGLGSPQPPLGAHLLSCPIGAIPGAQPTAELIRLASIAHTPTGLDSNPHSTRPPLAPCHTARGFLPRGHSMDAFRASPERALRSLTDAGRAWTVPREADADLRRCSGPTFTRGRTEPSGWRPAGPGQGRTLGAPPRRLDLHLSCSISSPPTGGQLPRNLELKPEPNPSGSLLNA